VNPSTSRPTVPFFSFFVSDSAKFILANWSGGARRNEMQVRSTGILRILKWFRGCTGQLDKICPIDTLNTFTYEANRESLCFLGHFANTQALNSTLELLTCIEIALNKFIKIISGIFFLTSSSLMIRYFIVI
jgi:hypothetical protein